MSQKQGESECLHLSVDLVAKTIAAKFLCLNSACLEVQNVHTCIPRISQSGSVSITEREGRHGVASSEAWRSLAPRYGSMTQAC